MKVRPENTDVGQNKKIRVAVESPSQTITRSGFSSFLVIEKKKTIMQAAGPITHTTYVLVGERTLLHRVVSYVFLRG
jgi:hypothetical protein